MYFKYFNQNIFPSLTNSIDSSRDVELYDRCYISRASRSQGRIRRCYSSSSSAEAKTVVAGVKSYQSAATSRCDIAHVSDNGSTQHVHLLVCPRRVTCCSNHSAARYDWTRYLKSEPNGASNCFRFDLDLLTSSGRIVIYSKLSHIASVIASISLHQLTSQQLADLSTS